MKYQPFGEKNVKIGQVDPEIIRLIAIFKKEKNPSGKTYSPFNKFVEQAKLWR